MRPATGQVYNNQNNNAGWQFQNMNGNQAHHQVNGMLGFPQNMARPHTAAQINQNGYFMGHYSQFNNMQQNRPQNFGQVPAQYQHILQPEAFQCSCGLQLHRKEIPHHFNQCQAIHQKYENVYKAISSQFECSNSPQEFKNLQHMLLSFADRAQELSRMNGKIQNQQQQVSQNQDQLFQCIQSNPIQPQINPLQQQQAQINPISYQKNMQMPLQQLPPQSQKQLFGFQEQMPTSQRNTFSLNNNNQYDNHQPRHTDVIVNEVNLLDNIENQIPQQNINNDKQGGLSNLFVEMEDEEDKEQFLNQTTPLEQCSICLIEIKKQDEEIVLESCFHYCHRSCLVQYVMQEYPKGQGVNCPRCGKGVSEREFRQQFSDEQKRQFEKLEQQLLKEGMGENFVQCSCGNGMFIEEGEPDYNQKDEMGQKISREAAEHMSKYRVRCNECNKVFCSECRIEPYHLGKTCEQFKDFKQSKKCRYCWEKMSEPSISPHEALQDVCRKQECIAIMKQACTKMLPNCGHPCSGFANEPRCLPCLDPECVKKDESITLGEDSSSYCSICAICGLGDLPSVQLDCKHIFHLDCIKQKLQKRWPGPRIVFSYLNCTCKKRIKATYCQELTTIVKQARKFEKEIKKKAIERGKYENLEKDAKLKDKFIDPNHRFYKNFDLMCMESLSYYECFECKQAYFGGQKNCENANEEAKGEFKPQELVCGRCSAKNVGMGEQNCKKHGMDYIEFKCKFCCDIAQWFCWGNTHFCEKCHTRQNNGDYVSRKPKSDLPKCPGEEKCPLRVKHPANGEEFSLGCSICRNEKQNVKNF